MEPSSGTGTPETLEPTHAPEPQRPWAKLKTRLRRRITAGLILVVPIWVTFFLVTFMFALLRDASLWVVEAILLSRVGEPLLSSWGVTREQLAGDGLQGLPSGLQWGIGFLAVVLTVFLLYALGSITTNVLGNRIVRLLEMLVDRVPFVKTVYRASKQVLETFSGSGPRGYQRVVLVPFPTKETLSVGFVTSITKDVRSGEDIYSVFVATTPNPTTGFVFIVRRTDVIELGWNVEEAVKVVMSGGVLMPDTISFIRPSAISVASSDGAEQVSPVSPAVPEAPRA